MQLTHLISLSLVIFSLLCIFAGFGFGAECGYGFPTMPHRERHLNLSDLALYLWRKIASKYNKRFLKILYAMEEKKCTLIDVFPTEN